MTMERREFLVAARLEGPALDAWMAAGWLRPRGNGEAGPFSEVDLARAQLIRDLGELGVNDEGIPVVLDLIDQLQGLRGALRDLIAAVGTRPEVQRRQILSGLRSAHSKMRARS
jgi:chaperone modulatory protein CbpM